MDQHPDHQRTDMIPEFVNMTDQLFNPHSHPNIRNTLTAIHPNGRTPRSAYLTTYLDLNPNLVAILQVNIKFHDVSLCSINCLIMAKMDHFVTNLYSVWVQRLVNLLKVLFNNVFDIPHTLIVMFNAVSEDVHHPRMARLATLVFNLKLNINIIPHQTFPKLEERPGAYGEGIVAVQYVHEPDQQSTGMIPELVNMTDDLINANYDPDIRRTRIASHPNGKTPRPAYLTTQPVTPPPELPTQLLTLQPSLHSELTDIVDTLPSVYTNDVPILFILLPPEPVKLSIGISTQVFTRLPLTLPPQLTNSSLDMSTMPVNFPTLFSKFKNTLMPMIIINYERLMFNYIRRRYLDLNPNLVAILQVNVRFHDVSLCSINCLIMAEMDHFVTHLYSLWVQRLVNFLKVLFNNVCDIPHTLIVMFKAVSEDVHHPRMARLATLVFSLTFDIDIIIRQIIPDSEESPDSYDIVNVAVQYVHKMENKLYIDVKFQPEKEAMHESPVSVGVASNGTIFFGPDRERVGQVAEERRREIVNLYKQYGTLYCGSSFLFWTPSDINESSLEWLRPLTTNVIYNKPTPGDVLQGGLGNCWLIAALALLAQFPDVLERVVQTRDHSEQGVYVIRLCIDGLWRSVNIDDCLPCDSEGKLIFAKAKNDQLWVPLIEKAVATSHGSYKSLECGLPAESIAKFTGLPCECIVFKDEYSHYIYEADTIWWDLLHYYDSNFMLCTSTDNSKVVDDVGLSTKHCYSVLAVEENEGNRTITLRDPNGRSKWKGNGSADADSNNQGIISMNFEDYLKYFESFTAGATDPGNMRNELRLQGVFSSSPRHQDMTIWKLKVHVFTKVTLVLYQQGYRRTKNRQRPLDLRLVLLRDDGVGIRELVHQSWHDDASHVSLHKALHPGEYLAVPLAFNHWNNEANSGGTRSNVLAVHSDKHVICEEITDVGKDYSTISADTMIQLAVAGGEKHQISPGVTSYYENTCCGSTLVIENGEQQALRVDCYNNEYDNIVSTRDTRITVDVIPPRHRQVIMILTKLLAPSRPMQQPKVKTWLQNDESDSTYFVRSTAEPPSFLHEPRPL